MKDASLHFHRNAAYPFTCTVEAIAVYIVVGDAGDEGLVVILLRPNVVRHQVWPNTAVGALEDSYANLAGGLMEDVESMPGRILHASMLSAGTATDTPIDDEPRMRIPSVAAV